MEQQKKFSAFDIVNICILGIGVIITTIFLILPKPVMGDTVSIIIQIIANVAAIVALISAVLYMIMRYTKKSAVLYKIYMYAFVAGYAMLVLIALTAGLGNMLNSIIMVVIFLLTVVLATAKDYGKVKTFIIAGLLLVAHIVFCIVGFGGNIQPLPCLINLILTAEACIMVLAKYHDKDARGAK